MGKIGLIISREFSQRVRKRSFIIITLLTPLLMVAMVAIPALISVYGGDNTVREVVVVEGATPIVGDRLQNADNITFTTTLSSYPSVVAEHPSAYAFLVIEPDVVQNPTFKFYTREASTLKIENEINNQLSAIITKIRIGNTGVAGLDSLIAAVKVKASIQTFEIGMSQTGELAEKASSSGASMWVAYGSSLVIYMFILLYGMMVLQGVVEEKANRIIEVIVCSVKPFELMMGKILGVALVALLQFGVWIVIGGAALALMPTGDPSVAAAGGASMSPLMSGAMATMLDPMFLLRVVGSFIVFFIGGYLLYASMFAAVGSAVDNVGDTQQLQMPITMPLIVSIFIMVSVMQNPHSAAAFWFSIIPFTSPIIMLARVAYGVAWWEFLLSVGLLYGSFVGMTYIASKIYRTGIFMYGKKPNLREIIRWARYR